MVARILVFIGCAVVLLGLFLVRKRLFGVFAQGGKGMIASAIVAAGLVLGVGYFLLGGQSAPNLEEIKYIESLCKASPTCKDGRSGQCRARKLKCEIRGTECHFAPEGSGPRHRVRPLKEGTTGVPLNWECWDGQTSPWHGEHYVYPLSDTIK